MKRLRALQPTLMILIGMALAVCIPVSGSADESTSPSWTPPDGYVLKVGYFEFPGLAHTDENGEPAGFVNEITEKTLTHAGIPYEIESFPAARFYDGLSAGKIHLFNGLSSIPAVRESTISSDIELFPIEMRVYWVGDKPPVQKKEDLVGRSVILVRGFTYKDWGEWIRNPDNGVQFTDTNTHDSGFKMLRRGRADYLLNYKYIDTDVMSRIGEIPDLKIHNLFRWSCYFNVQKDVPDAAGLLKTLEKSYRELIAAGELSAYD